MQLPKLDFKETFDFQFKKDKDTFFIYDLPRKSWLVLTPEEWVRQHWIHYFHKTKGYHLSALITEQKLELNGTTKRLDLLVTEKTKPKILIECKAPSVPLTEATFEQIARYNSIIKSPEIILSNGVQHIYAKYENENYTFYKRELY
ncbi:type I restriction enzyme HsdR N-terminal domain-containing protein [Riemerella anatipestifer]|uniref:type I restriction enzyme HsdR N-terminal domain-containing protein n=1 Tax=Riemerella anatipestifer TaxID=34085 RepID=UPI0013752BA5|nr:type I restriction enzyme HsdR N-terminal domain-containing protein [Riemerella anatipestifer]MDY3338672.1 type I restriction enzyme HsdR N-terminal domain-containing protein [Riemerella anatipestifer]MDY3362887.1 type I restriction enzyme HsdR N-terminal domain-containing protein [Riemerella anatipestifer]MDY3520456.1 type I restriction enzyme HsdR N-terminal domain-containing protein [Riemerella anatipestifer]MDY3532491.1 type I restriction enzyme HsdR N-terminal domain-containing protein 